MRLLILDIVSKSGSFAMLPVKGSVKCFGDLYKISVFRHDPFEKGGAAPRPASCSDCKYSGDCMLQEQRAALHTCPAFLARTLSENFEGAEVPAKLRNNVIRARSTVLELALCNRWDWFFTATLDGAKRDRFDIGAYKRQLAQWVRNYRRDNGGSVRYLLVPEMHRDGAWHMHGFLAGLPDGAVAPFGKGTPRKLRDKGYMNWPAYAKAFGFCSLDAVHDAAAAAIYVSKYITKSIDVQGGIATGKHLYLCSRGLQRAEVLAKGALLIDRLPAYQNVFGATELTGGTVIVSDDLTPVVVLPELQSK